MRKLEIKDQLGASISIDQYGNNMILINPKCDVLIDKEVAAAIVKTLSENFDLKQD